jgi:hypothetical protein
VGEIDNEINIYKKVERVRERERDLRKKLKQKPDLPSETCGECRLKQEMRELA